MFIKRLLFARYLAGHDAKAETPVLWPPHAKSWLIGKDSDAGRDWGQEEKGTTEDEMAGWHHWLDGRESEWLRELVREAWRAAIHGVAKSRARLSDWTELNWRRVPLTGTTRLKLTANGGNHDTECKMGFDFEKLGFSPSCVTMRDNNFFPT